MDDTIFGTIERPAGVAQFDSLTGAEDGIGLIIFISRLIQIGTIVAGIWVMLNFILAGYDYITSAGDTGAAKRVTDRITMSVIGLLIIVAAYSLTAIVSLLIFGDASYILNPQICGPTGCEAPAGGGSGGGVPGGGGFSPGEI